MTATVTLDTTGYDYYGSDNDFRTSIKAGLAGIGVTQDKLSMTQELKSSVKSVMVLELMQIII